MTFHDPGVPLLAAADTVEVCRDTSPSVIEIVAVPTGPPALPTLPDSVP